VAAVKNYEDRMIAGAAGISPKGNTSDGPSAIAGFPTAFPSMVLCALTDVVMLVMAIRQILIGKNGRLKATWLLLIGA
jgi:hypothetical protein